jgi:hypothetical protein
MCFSSTPVPPTAAKIFVLSNSDSVVRDFSESLSPCQASKFVGVPGGEGWYPTGGRCVPHWGTVCTPLGDGAYPTGGRCVSHWGMVCTPLGDGVYPTGVRCLPHWGTVGVPPGYASCQVILQSRLTAAAIVLLKLSAPGSGSIQPAPPVLSSPDQGSAPDLP